MIAIKAVQRTNTLLSHFRMASSVLNYDYDLVVIGGGSGGLSAAKEATKQNPQAKVNSTNFQKFWKKINISDDFFYSLIWLISTMYASGYDFK